MMTMREKLIEAIGRLLLSDADWGDAQNFGETLEEQSGWLEGYNAAVADQASPAAVLDAILSTLREPDEAMIDAYAEGVPVSDLHAPGEWNMKVEGYTALIDHVRGGK